MPGQSGGCGCSAGSKQELSEQDRARQSSFEEFWPVDLPFPPLAPWLATSVPRADAFTWAVEVGILDDDDVRAGDRARVLHLIGVAMAGSGLYAKARRKWKDRLRNRTHCGMICDGERIEWTCREGQRCEGDCSGPRPVTGCGQGPVSSIDTDFSETLAE